MNMNVFICEICNYKTDKKSNLKRHFQCKKHINKCNLSNSSNLISKSTQINLSQPKSTYENEKKEQPMHYIKKSMNNRKKRSKKKEQIIKKGATNDNTLLCNVNKDKLIEFDELLVTDELINSNDNTECKKDKIKVKDKLEVKKNGKNKINLEEEKEETKIVEYKKNIEDKDIIEDINLSNDDKLLKTVEILKKNNNISIFICYFCNNKFKKKFILRRHLIKDCIIIPDKYRNRFLEKHNKHGNTKNKIEIHEISNNKINIINNNITNLNNFNNCINNNIKQICFNPNKHIEINPMFYESIEHLTESEKISILQGKLEVYELLLNKLYESTSNRNVFIADKREKIIKYLDKNGILRSTDAVKFITKMVNFNMFRIEELLEDVKAKLHPKTFKVIKSLYDKYHNNDEKICKELDKQTYIKLLDISDMNKKNFENMYKIEDIITGKEMIIVEVECNDKKN
jgi:hypothetical protein